MGSTWDSPRDQSPKYGNLSLNSLDDIELERLLEGPSALTDNEELETSGSATSQQSIVATSVSRRLYISHFLSTWNSRVFEFGAVLFLAKIYPGTLLPVSIYAVVRSASAIVLSPKVGRYIDINDRLKVVRTSIGKSLEQSSPTVCNANYS